MNRKQLGIYLAVILQMFFSTITLANEDKEDLNRAMELQSLGNDTWETLIQRVEQPSDRNNNIGLFLKLRALFRLYPETTFKAAEVLCQSEFNTPKSEALMQALTSARTSESESALTYLLTQKSSDEKVVISIFGSLMGSSNPQQKTEDIIREIALSSPNKDISNSAWLTLGAIGRTLLTTGPDRALVILDELEDRVRNAPDPIKKELAIGALGNLGAPQSFLFLNEYLSERKESIREKATESLRFIYTSEAQEALLKILSSDESETVRIAAVYALSVQPPNQTLIDAQTLILKKEKSIWVMKDILENLERGARSIPSAKAGVLETLKFYRQNSPTDFWHLCQRLIDGLESK